MGHGRRSWAALIAVAVVSFAVGAVAAPVAKKTFNQGLIDALNAIVQPRSGLLFDYQYPPDPGRPGTLQLDVAPKAGLDQTFAVNALPPPDADLPPPDADRPGALTFDFSALPPPDADAPAPKLTVNFRVADPPEPDAPAALTIKLLPPPDADHRFALNFTDTTHFLLYHNGAPATLCQGPIGGR